MKQICTAVSFFLVACRISAVPQLGMEPMPRAVEARSLNHWITREVPCNAISYRQFLDLGGHRNSFSVVLAPFLLTISQCFGRWCISRPSQGTKLSGMIHIQLSIPAYLKPPSIICHGISGILTPIMGATALVHAARKLPDTPQLVPSKEINNGQKPKTDASIKVMIPCPVSGPD